MSWLRSITLLLAAALLGAAMPAGQMYRVDAVASNLSAKVPFLGLGSKTAGFPDVAGTIQITIFMPLERSVMSLVTMLLRIQQQRCLGGQIMLRECLLQTNSSALSQDQKTCISKPVQMLSGQALI